MACNRVNHWGEAFREDSPYTGHGCLRARREVCLTSDLSLIWGELFSTPASMTYFLDSLQKAIHKVKGEQKFC